MVFMLYLDNVKEIFVMENVNQLTCKQLIFIDVAINWDDIFVDTIGGLMGVGLVAAACTPGLNVVVAAGLAYGGSWEGDSCITSTIIGFVK